ncbi:hypothetical protein ACFQZZ_19880 [Nocardia sp. GCM10030253]|uniref:hypothetical protein n=1 Tax=Nocardia sp. GCM10030253 TaxID=3273404 RepID=UPI00364433C8
MRFDPPFDWFGTSSVSPNLPTPSAADHDGTRFCLAGPCLFGHVDPNDENSACRGSDSATWPESEAGPDSKDQWGNKYYDWTEVLGS